MKIKNSIIQIFCYIIFLAPFIAVLPAHAQIAPDITISTKPVYPKPGQTVVISLDSAEINLDFETITWYVNGKLVASGQAATSIQLEISSDASTRYSVRALIGAGVSPVSREIEIVPGNIVLLWEAVDSYVPSWYQGKALSIRDSTVRVTAVPVGAPTMDRLFFLWKYGSRTQSDQSGFGKNSIVIKKSSLTGDLPVLVTASMPDGSYTTQGVLTVPTSAPDVRFWAPRSVGSSSYARGGILSILDNPATVEALPYYMQSRDGLRSIGYTWMINGTDYQPDEGEPNNQIYVDNAAKIATVNVQSITDLTSEAIGAVRLVFP